MHKLRSMTETIKMLSKENESLRGENSDLLRATTRDDNQPGNNGGKTKQDMGVQGECLPFPGFQKVCFLVFLSTFMFCEKLSNTYETL